MGGCTSTTAAEDPAAPTASTSQRKWTRNSKKRADFQLAFLGLDQGGKTSLIHSLVYSQHYSSDAASDGGTSGAPGGETAASGAAPAPSSSDEPAASVGRAIVPPPTSTILSNVVLIEDERIELIDLPGDPKERRRWEEVVDCATGVVFVVDSADPMRIPVAKRELWNMVNRLRDKCLPTLVLANKQDVDRAMDVQNVAGALDLLSLRSLTDPAPITVRASSMFNPTDTKQALKWLLTAVVSLASLKKAEGEMDDLADF